VALWPWSPDDVAELEVADDCSSSLSVTPEGSLVVVLLFDLVCVPDPLQEASQTVIRASASTTHNPTPMGPSLLLIFFMHRSFPTCFLP
jgi:hypothetical protein